MKIRAERHGRKERGEKKLIKERKDGEKGMWFWRGGNEKAR